MSLSAELISQFVKSTKDDKKTNQETVAYGTYIGNGQVQLDGSDQVTPVSSTADAKVGERVSVLIKNHHAMITGNVTSPSARLVQVEAIDDTVQQLDKLFVSELTVEELNASTAYIDDLIAAYANIGELEAVNAIITSIQTKFLEAGNIEVGGLEAKYITADDIIAINADIQSLIAANGEFKDLSAEELEAVNAAITNLQGHIATFDRVTTTELLASNGKIDILESEKLSAKSADIQYAKIDFTNIGEAAMQYFYANSGLIKNVVVKDAAITGEIVGVTIKGDLIEGGTVVADKLVLRGMDGLYYALNYDADSEGTKAATTNVYYKVTLSEIYHRIIVENVFYKVEYSEGSYISTSEVISEQSTDTPIENVYVSDGDIEYPVYKAVLDTDEDLYFYIKTEYIQTDEAHPEAANISTVDGLTTGTITIVSSDGTTSEEVAHLYLKETYIATDEKLELTEAGTVVENAKTITNDDIYSIEIDGETILYCVRIEYKQWVTNEISGKVLAAESVTADKIHVSDLTAFGADIACFKINVNEETNVGVIRSIGKENASVAGEGIYMDTNGEFYVGNIDNYIRFYKNEDGVYKLEILADSMKFASASDDKLKAFTDYVDIGRTDDKPSITLREVGKNENQIITSTSTTYIDDSGETGTTITAEGITTEDLDIKGDLRRGNWAWVEHDGNWGLVWRG